MFNIKLPFWLNKKGSEINKIRSLFHKWWMFVWEYCLFLLKLTDEEKCSETVLNLIAYQRNITRFENEPLSLFRKRVKYALINAKDAGSTKGFQNIFMRLGVGYVELEERFDETNWDTIKIKVSDSQIAKNPQLMNEIIRHYGRTCRRYTFEILNNQNITLFHGEFDGEYQCFPVRIEL